MAVKLLAGYHVWDALPEPDPQIHCGACGSDMTLLTLEHDLETDQHVVTCWNGHRYVADANDPFIARMLAKLATEGSSR